MRRKIDGKLLEWKGKPKHKALLIRGPRQAGKTYAVRKFAKQNYSKVIEINFEDHPEYKHIFEEGTSAERLFDVFGFEFKMKSFEDCLIFMDEIQLCPEAMSSLKPLVQDGRCDVIGSGSMLGDVFGKKSLTPIGYVDMMQVNPMDFEEFLWAMGLDENHTADITRHIRELEPFDDFILGRLNDLFRKYVVIGGMPEAVDTYVKTGLYGNVIDSLDHILKLVSEDSTKYVNDPMDSSRIRHTLNAVPIQLSCEGNNSFNYSSIELSNHYGQREYGPAIQWLSDAGVVDLCYNVEGISEPLRPRSSGSVFKIYMKDTGILTMMSDPTAGSSIVLRDKDFNAGAAMENAVLESLLRKRYRVYYYSNSQKRIEVDFVAKIFGKLSVIEVKSGRKKGARSLNKALADFDSVKQAIKLAEFNIGIEEDGIIHLPLFAFSFIDECVPAELPSTDYMEDLREALLADSEAYLDPAVKISRPLM